MSKTKHTPGPWKALELDHDLPGYDVVAGNDVGCRICEVDAEMVAREQAVADARLIAAAPALLAALRNFVVTAEWVIDWAAAKLGDTPDINAAADAFEEARAAITAATEKGA